MTPKELNKKTLLSIIKNKGRCTAETNCTHCSVRCLDIIDMNLSLDYNTKKLIVNPMTRKSNFDLKYKSAIKEYNKLHIDDDNGELMEALL